MNRIGIFFGTDSGTTRLMAKKMSKKPGDVADKPLNVNRTEASEFMGYDALIVGTPSYGEGQLPGVATGVQQGSWEEFLLKLENADMSGRRVALYGLGNQDKYTAQFGNNVPLV